MGWLRQEVYSDLRNFADATTYYRRQARDEIKEAARDKPQLEVEWDRLKAHYDQQGGLLQAEAEPKDEMLGVWLALICDVRELRGEGWPHTARSLGGARWEGESSARMSPRRAHMYQL